MHIAGVDGCRAGWLCVEECEGRLDGHIFRSFAELLAAMPGASVIAVDIPIGLPEQGKRDCDTAARRALSPTRTSSVFPTPVQGVLHEERYAVACQKHRDIDGRGLSRQAFSILPKIREVNLLLQPNPGLQQRVREIHPEVCFAFWNWGVPMPHRKSSPVGQAERERLIDAEWPAQREVILDRLQGRYEIDDLNDAFAALWTAKRIASGTARVFGDQSIDKYGLRMEMWA
jgi:predicted RNase H-like nuclease